MNTLYDDVALALALVLVLVLEGRGEEKREEDNVCRDKN